MAEILMARSTFNGLPLAEQGEAVRNGVKVVDTLPAGRKAWEPPAQKTIRRDLFTTLAPADAMAFVKAGGLIL